MSMDNSKKECVSLWAQPVSGVFGCLETSEKGLSSGEAAKRLARFGPNSAVSKGRRHGICIFLSQFRNPMVIILVIAAIIAFFMHERIDVVVILAIVFLTSVLGFVQEYKAERALRALNRLVTARAKVLRDGEIVEVDAKFLVPGDIVHLNIGDIIPADIRLVNVEEMSTDESSLTGESVPVIKDVKIVPGSHSLPQYLTNVAFAGTSVSSGLGYGVVIATGRNSFFGRTAALVKKAPHEADFQKNMHKFSNFLLKVIVIMTAFVFVANAVLGRGFFDSFLFALALAVGITPEILPVITTIALSNGALRMAKDRVIVKRLVSVEDLGNIDTLCCDKTGTLTEGTLTLMEYICVDGRHDDKLVLYGLLCSAAKGGMGRKSLGNPLDKAIWNSPKARELEPQLAKFAVVDENEFDFERKRMSVVVKTRKGNLLIAKGAPDSVFRVCSKVLYDSGRKQFSEALRKRLGKVVEDYERSGYRVIAVAEKRINKTETFRADENKLDLVGFLLFLDPPKKTAKDALDTLQKLGVNIKVISGDSPFVTRKICSDVGVKVVDGRVITGEELSVLDAKQFEHYSHNYNVFARVTPEQKYRIVSCLNKEGHIVGFLGDGINDAPALRAADVGISVDSAAGIAKEAADVILLKKSLNVLARGITEGRKTFGNITKYIMNTISANYGNMFTLAISSLFMNFIPLLPSQILLNNLMSDIPNMAISTDRVDAETLKKPKRWDLKLISRFMVYFGLISTFFDLALILPLLFIFHATPEVFRTAWFVESAISEIIIVFAIRTRMPFFRSMPGRWLVLSSLLTIGLTVGITYTLFGAKFFEFVVLPVDVMILMAGVLVCYFITAEIAKRRFFRHVEA
jgi:Mg2+-importing ATPase